MTRKTFKSDIPSSEITPEALYASRRKFMRLAALGGVAFALAACAPGGSPTGAPTPIPPGEMEDGTPAPNPTTGAALKDELGNPANSFEQITNYNNFYEFSEGKEEVAPLSKDFDTSGWKVEVSGLVNQPRTYSMDDLLKFPQEERIYRLRCVEAWSMVIPWQGFPLAALLKEVEPQGSAKYVRFTSAALPEQMPGVKSPFYPWPYIEGLRLDEAMNDLALLVTGLYGKPLPPQDGAPLRLAVPWKYGFKSAKSLVKIELVAEQPVSFWTQIASNEYGFYANVNPEVDHPRWSQASERRIGELSRRKTLPFNGYAEQVSSLYAGMDLAANY
jgi:sulfoxide reductase catalytic subunit YedY